MMIAGKTILVTGASRGIGRALVDEALLLAGRGITVHAVLTGPTDTDMIRDWDIPKAAPWSVARAVLDGVEKGEEDIFPDPWAQSLADSWHHGAAKVPERQIAESMD